MLEYIKSDYTRYYGSGSAKMWKIILSVVLGKNHCFVFSFWLRLCMKKTVLYPIARLMHRKYARKFGLQIPVGTKIGYGLYIGHGIGIVINQSAVIGNNVNLSQFLTIGTNKKTGAVIGDNVYIGPSVCIVEDVHIGNNTTVGAGAVVTKDIPDNATVVGAPAKVLNYNDPGRYVNRRWVM